MNVKIVNSFEGILVNGIKIGCNNKTEITNSKSQIANNIQ